MILEKIAVVGSISGIAIGSVVGPDAAGSAVAELAKSGFMGTCLVVLGYALVKVYNNGRIDQQKLHEIIAENTSAQKEAAESHRAQSSTLGRLIDSTRDCPAKK